MTPASYKADAPPMMCECGLMLRGNESRKRGFCGRCWRQYKEYLARKKKKINPRKLHKQYKKSKHPWGFGKV